MEQLTQQLVKLYFLLFEKPTAGRYPMDLAKNRPS